MTLDGNLPQTSRLFGRMLSRIKGGEEPGTCRIAFFSSRAFREWSNRPLASSDCLQNHSHLGRSAYGIRLWPPGGLGMRGELLERQFQLDGPPRHCVALAVAAMVRRHHHGP